MQAMSRDNRPRVIIDNVAIDNVSMEEALRIVEAHVDQGRGLLVVTPNVDHLLRLRGDEEFRQAYAQAGLVLADGHPLLWLARLQGTPLKAKVSGADFLVEFCRAAAAHGRRLFLLGGVEDVAQKTADALRRDHPGLIIVGAYSPTMGFESKEEENRRIVDLVREHRPDVLFVATGAPKQEKWVLRHFPQLDPIVCVGVGAAFDFISGRVPRAPRWMRNSGLEWFWRLLHEPRRLFYRYVVEDFPFFVGLFVKTIARRLAANVWFKPVLVLALTALFYIAIFGAQPLLRAGLQRMPENYQHLALAHTQQGDHEQALTAIGRELRRYPYNFHAQLLRAEILHQAGRSEEALRLLGSMRETYRSIRERSDVPSRGWSEARLHMLLARTLWDIGRCEVAIDHVRAAMDLCDPEADDRVKAFVDSVSRKAAGDEAAWAYVARAFLDPTKVLDPIPETDLFPNTAAPAGFHARLARVAVERHLHQIAKALLDKELHSHPLDVASLCAYRWFFEQMPLSWTKQEEQRAQLVKYEIDRRTAGLAVFKTARTPEAVTELHWASLLRNVTVTGQVEIKQPATSVCLIARGQPCYDFWPVLSLRIDDCLVGQRYVCSNYYEPYALPISLGPGNYSVSVALENDEYNPLTKADRNLEIKEIRFY